VCILCNHRYAHVKLSSNIQYVMTYNICSIGDTIPSVVASIFPSIVNVPILDLLTHRRFVIVLCTVCVSYPLSLYRDISKLAKASGLALISMVVIVVAVAVEGPQVASEFRGRSEVRWDFIHRELFQVGELTELVCV